MTTSGNTVVLPEGQWFDVLTAQEYPGGPVELTRLLERFPCAVLEEVSDAERNHQHPRRRTATPAETGPSGAGRRDRGRPARLADSVGSSTREEERTPVQPAPNASTARRCPMSGSEVLIRLWAPLADSAFAVVDGRGYRCVHNTPLLDDRLAAGTDYLLAIRRPRTAARPAQRPTAVRRARPSRAFDTSAYRWNDAQWPGIDVVGSVLLRAA
jgi:hypothetical protein